MDNVRLGDFVATVWAQSVVPEITEYIRIPNKSPAFDADWQAHGYMDEAVAQFERWARSQPLRDMEVEAVRLPGRTPLLYMEIPGAGAGTILLYGHLDKQPETSGWRAGLGPWQPVFEGQRLYGRGAADDGYALFSALTALAGIQAQGLKHAHCIIIIEACEESGSFDLPHYIELLSDRIGAPDLVICLDSGCGDYERLWCTTSLRGLIGGVVKVEVLTEGVHSGDASGIVPSSFRILRQILNRLEDAETGAILPPDFSVDIPEERIEQARRAAQVLGSQVHAKFPFSRNTRAAAAEPLALILNRTWRPALAVVGAEGLPSLREAGNVLLPATSVKVSLRLPPTCNAVAAAQALKQLLQSAPPYDASVTFTPDWSATGWNAPPLAEWLENAIDAASRTYFNQPAVYMGEGGTIPFMAMLGERYPHAQFLITGVLGPGSNAHGPNEFLDIPTAKRLTCCIARVIVDHYRHGREGG